ncbi:putative flippase GtrA [Paenibacillus phyllosphaerae]|uniref:Putative flippase GtrA n=1 Tax=Paenibacillus phyllosphaerae TaxID=274593 RepID=A0A7W5ATZ6_9BACL|nr:GtrA family protein [Paenibacillus phyllosphaerae]MBB3108755.1 putative flippase GtrA [Paenibacillus phyllosphaerae]
MKLLQHSFVRFVLVGIMNTLIGLTLIYICLNWLGFGYWASTFIGNTLGAVNSFFMNRSFTFRSGSGIASTAWRFALLTLGCWLLAYGLADKGAEVLARQLLPGLQMEMTERTIHNIAALAGSGLYTILGYIGSRWLVFRKAKEKIEWESVR